MTKKRSKQEENQSHVEAQANLEDKEVPKSFDESMADAGLADKDDVAALKQALEEAQAKATENWEKLLRKEAEMQNVRKRAETEVSEARKYSIVKFAQELLAVVDSFDQALSHKEEYEKGEQQAAQSIFEGMALTHKVLLDVMGKFGIQELNPVDETFNPQYHEAIMMQESDAHKPNQIMTVVQKGFLVHDRVLRPARVIVAKAVSTPTE